MTHEISNNSKTPRGLITKLARQASEGLITVSTASKALDLPQKQTALILASLYRKGWLLRPKRGLYYILPLESAPGQQTTTEDSWVLAKALFPSGYIGGWSAAGFWELTEQLFRSTLVITTDSIRSSKTTALGHSFHIFRVKNIIPDGLTSVWRGNEQVLVSDRERTLIDCFRNPELCGGISHLGSIMDLYQSSKDHDFSLLLSRARVVANGAAWKRLGYLAEIFWPQAKKIITEAQKNISAGNSKLDPNIVEKGHLVKKWHLWVNLTLNKPEST